MRITQKILFLLVGGVLLLNGCSSSVGSKTAQSVEDAFIQDVQLRGLSDGLSLLFDPVQADLNDQITVSSDATVEDELCALFRGSAQPDVATEDLQLSNFQIIHVMRHATSTFTINANVAGDFTYVLGCLIDGGRVGGRAEASTQNATGGGGPAPTTNTNVIEQGAFQVVFAENHNRAQFTGSYGRYYMVENAPGAGCTVESYTPEYKEISGQKFNGAMINPGSVGPDTHKQGYANQPFMASSSYEQDLTARVPFTMHAGDAAVIVKSRTGSDGRVATDTWTNRFNQSIAGNINQFDDAIVFYCMDEVKPVNMFSPGFYGQPSNRIYHTTDDIDLSRVPNFITTANPNEALTGFTSLYNPNGGALYDDNREAIAEVLARPIIYMGDNWQGKISVDFDEYHEPIYKLYSEILAFLVVEPQSPNSDELINALQIGIEIGSFLSVVNKHPSSIFPFFTHYAAVVLDSPVLRGIENAGRIGWQYYYCDQGAPPSVLQAVLDAGVNPQSVLEADNPSWMPSGISYASYMSGGNSNACWGQRPVSYNNYGVPVHVNKQHDEIVADLHDQYNLLNTNSTGYSGGAYCSTGNAYLKANITGSASIYIAAKILGIEDKTNGIVTGSNTSPFMDYIRNNWMEITDDEYDSLFPHPNNSRDYGGMPSNYSKTVLCDMMPTARNCN